jgi:plant cysteine oxidase
MNWLLLASDGIEAADVGIDDGEKSSSSSSDDELSPKGARLLPALAFERITYVHIHQCDDFSVRSLGWIIVAAGLRVAYLCVDGVTLLIQMGVFCFPAGASLPLHDHPEMVVLSKLLYGSVRKRSYDWVADEAPCSGERKRKTHHHAATHVMCARLFCCSSF